MRLRLKKPITKHYKSPYMEILRHSWRPLMAFTLILILFLYLVVGFFLSIYKIEYPPLPDGAWALMSVFAGAYTLARGAEKSTANWTGNNVDSQTDDSDTELDADVIDDETEEQPDTDTTNG